MHDQISPRKIVVTEDGSHTLFVHELNEHYHSIHGAIQESMHVFIAAGFKNFTHKNSISILEVGFGTGLNAFLTLGEAQLTKQSVFYTSIEKYPITLDEIETLNYVTELDSGRVLNFKQLHSVAWNVFESIGNEPSTSSEKAHFQLKKVQIDLLNFSTDDKFDLIYFDAFSPNVQPELWSERVFAQMYNYLNPGGLLVTYSAKGFVKRNLRTAGFVVKRIPGPPGKREMLRASKFQ